MYAQNTIKYSMFSKELQQKDTIKNLGVSLEPYTIATFSTIDFSAYTKLTNVKIQLELLGEIVDENEQNIEFISIENQSFGNLKLEQLNWEIVNLSHTQLKFGNTFDNLSVHKLIVHPFEGHVTFPVFTSKLKKLHAIEISKDDDDVSTIDLTNLNSTHIQSLTVKSMVLKPKAEKSIYKFNSLKSLRVFSYNTIDVSKFKNLKELVINISSEEQLQQIFKLKHLKKLTILPNTDFFEILNFEGIKKLKKLEFLEIKDIAIEIEVLCKLSENANLKEIHLDDWIQTKDDNSCLELLNRIWVR